MAAWLARHGIDVEIAEALAETAVTVERLDRLAAALDEDALGFALRSIGASCRTRLLTSEVESAAGRIHSLVAAIKGFTYMDQSNVPAPVSVAQGLSDTMSVLGGK